MLDKDLQSVLQSTWESETEDKDSHEKKATIDFHVKCKATVFISWNYLILKDSLEWRKIAIVHCMFS